MNAVEKHDSNSSDASSSERKRRARVLKKGKVLFSNGLRSLPCTIRNISEGGALLESQDAHLIPNEFDLYIELEDYDVSCERRWQMGFRCGVQFIGEKRQRNHTRTQVLLPSEQALNSDAHKYTGFANQREERQQTGPSKPVNRTRRVSKPGFGKRSV